MTSRDENCGTCRYQGGGYCRRRAPIRREDSSTPMWPFVSDTHWCGEWSPVETKTEEPR